MNKPYIKSILGVVFLSWVLLCTLVLAGTAQYTYDGLDRLVKVQYDDGTVIQYTYDALGNRLTEQVQALSEAAAASPPSRVQVSAPAPTAVASTLESLAVTGAGVPTVPAWPALLTKIRLAATAGDLEGLRGEIKDTLQQLALSPEDQARYEDLAALELEGRATFLRQGAAAGERTGTDGPAAAPREGAAGPRHRERSNKIVQDNEKIYTTPAQPGVEESKP